MKLDIIRICKKFKVSLDSIDLNKEVPDIISNIEDAILYDGIYHENPRWLMAELWRIECSYELKKLESTTSFNEGLREILDKDHYYIEDDFLVCDKLISCSMIQNNNRVSILNDIRQKKIKDLGYGISKYRILKNLNIQEVYCEGCHPNLNNVSNQFCLDSRFLDLPLNYENILLLEVMLSQFNISQSYLNRDELQPLMEIIDE